MPNLMGYNTNRPDQGRGVNGLTRVKAFRHGIPKAGNKGAGSVLMSAA